jgi:hypothetical protein
MDEPFDLPVTYKGEELLFNARFLQFGYTHKFAVAVNNNFLKHNYNQPNANILPHPLVLFSN